jgi:hypothetical protein
MFCEPLLVRGQVLLFHLLRQLVLHLLTANIHDIVGSTVLVSERSWVPSGLLIVRNQMQQSKNYSQNKKKQESYVLDIGILRDNKLQFLVKNMNFIFIKSISQFFSSTT